ncbi:MULTISPECIES: hypothetical protein [Stenotrophomonas]|uniref:hypothetical protein n=1 Tax=Stenotrophomonas TaxID=40323 RepID=UPI0018D37396|nr:hypothetical protein [Stenotrophomonas sp.]MBH1508371.1 hypothetical protein [Stenotrophomonas maltophilia]
MLPRLAKCNQGVTLPPEGSSASGVSVIKRGIEQALRFEENVKQCLGYDTEAMLGELGEMRRRSLSHGATFMHIGEVVTANSMHFRPTVNQNRM